MLPFRRISEEERRDPGLAARNPETVAHFEVLLEDWCRQIERYLETSLEHTTEAPDAGPRSEVRLLSHLITRPGVMMDKTGSR